MQRLYHRVRPTLFKIIQYKKILFALFLLSFLLWYLFPLFPFIPQATSLGTSLVLAKDNLKKDHLDRTNILLLGLGGPKTEPSGLTDTIIFTSLDRRKEKNILLSVPRDIWIPETMSKLNATYYLGNQEEGDGLETSRRAIESITGQPIHYMTVISFEGFTKVIDLLGGVDVMVEKDFTDNEYPIPGKENDLCGGDPKTKCRYETLVFSSGFQHLDGTTALKFARSRHSEGEEGTDFARAARQQKIIVAVKDKILSPSFFLNPGKIRQLLDIVNNSVETNIHPSEYAAFAKLALKVRNTPIKTATFPWDLQNIDTNTLLYHPDVSKEYNGQWVLLPRGDNWIATHKWVVCLFSQDNCEAKDFLELNTN